MSSKRFYRGRAATWLASFGTAVALTCGVVSPAVAAERGAVVMGDTTKLDPAGIDLGRIGSLTITKVGANPFDDPKLVPSRPIAGRELKLAKVATNLPINTPNGFAEAKALTVDAVNGASLGAPLVARTDAEGTAVFSGLTPGVYYLWEEPKPDAEGRYYLTAPILIMVPVASLDGMSWSYRAVIESKDELEGTLPEPPDEPPTVPGSSIPFLPLIPLIPLIPLVPNPPAPPVQPAPPAPPAPPEATPPAPPVPEKGIPRIPDLARTGSPVALLWLLAIAMLIAGAVGVRVGRARRNP